MNPRNPWPPPDSPPYGQHIVPVPFQVQVQAVTGAGDPRQDLAPIDLRGQVGGVTGLPGLFGAPQFGFAQERRQDFRLSGVGVGDVDVPDHFPRVPVQGDQAGVYGRRIDLVFRHRRSAVGGARNKRSFF